MSSQIGGFVYNLDQLDKLDPIFSADMREVRDDLEATMTHLKWVWTLHA